MTEEALNDLSHDVVGCAMRVHDALGPGLLESAYEVCLLHELKKREIGAESQVAMPVHYDGLVLEAGYRLDVVVAETIVVELKSVSKVTSVHEAQMLSYLKLSGMPLGLLMNFNVLRLKDGIKRLRL